MKRINEETRHMWLTISCGKNPGAFHVKNGKHICEICGKDFTEDAKEILIALQQSLLNIPN